MIPYQDEIRSNISGKPSSQLINTQAARGLLLIKHGICVESCQRGEQQSFQASRGVSCLFGEFGALPGSMILELRGSEQGRQDF